MLDKDYDELKKQYEVLKKDDKNNTKKKKTSKKFKTLYYEGSGNDTIKGITVPEGSYYITVTQSNCYSYDLCRAELFNKPGGAGCYEGEIIYFLGKGTQTYGYVGTLNKGYINIESDGKWTITIEKAE